MAGRLRYEAAPLDQRARGVLVGWLTGWFVVVACLLGWTVSGGGLLALGAAMVAATVLPLVLFARLAGFPSAFEVDGNLLRVRRHLLPEKTFVIRGPVATGRGPLRAGGAWWWTGAGFGCRWTEWAADADHRERVYLALTDASRAVRVGTDRGTVLASPVTPKPFAQAARAAARPGTVCDDGQR